VIELDSGITKNRRTGKKNNCECSESLKFDIPELIYSFDSIINNSVHKEMKFIF